MSLLSQDLAAAHCSSPSLPRSTHQREAVTGGPLAKSGKNTQERWGILGLELGKWGVTLTIYFLPQAPVSSATKASMGRATPARLWTASTTHSALSAAPVVSAPPVLDQGPPRPHALPAHMHLTTASSLACRAAVGSPPCIWTSTAAPPSSTFPLCALPGSPTLRLGLLCWS